MYALNIAVGLFAAIASAQMNAPPSCSLNCFQQAISQTSCGLLDFYCQCTEGADVITSSTIECLCESGACEDSELEDVRTYSNQVCQQSLEAEGETFTPVAYEADVCKAGSDGVAASASSAAAAPRASSTGGVMTGAAGNGSHTVATPSATASADAFEGAGARWVAEGSVVGVVALAAGFML